MLERMSWRSLFPIGTKLVRCCRTPFSPNRVLYSELFLLILASFSAITRAFSSTLHDCRDWRMEWLIIDSLLTALRTSLWPPAEGNCLLLQLKGFNYDNYCSTVIYDIEEIGSLWKLITKGSFALNFPTQRFHDGPFIKKARCFVSYESQAVSSKFVRLWKHGAIYR